LDKQKAMHAGHAWQKFRNHPLLAYNKGSVRYLPFTYFVQQSFYNENRLPVSTALQPSADIFKILSCFYPPNQQV
jgi:hypothetical protein